jgi:hypothetical protein
MNRAPTPTVATATTAAAAACSYTLTSAPVDRSANAADGATDDNHPQRPHRNLLAFGFGLNVFQWQWALRQQGRPGCCQIEDCAEATHVLAATH